jgi:GDPmannose 4,6-dehydratase
MNKTALITGISSQDGAYLSKLLLEKNYNVVGLIRNSQNQILSNLSYLGIKNQVQYEVSDLQDGINLSRIINKVRPDEIYNLAAQSSVSLSFEHPLSTMQYNCMSVLNLLELIKISDTETKFLQPGSSDMFGGSTILPINEKSNIIPRSPYAISKSLAYWAVKNYREAYSMFCSNAILFNHESYLRGGNFFIKKVINSAIKIRNKQLSILKLGNIDVKRDFGFAPEYVKAMWLILQSDIPDDYCICSGVSISLREIVEYVFDKLNISRDKIVIDPNLYRPVELLDIYGDNSKIKNNLNWVYDMSFFKVLDILIAEELSAQNYSTL